MITVYGVHGSPYVRKVFIALDIKDVPYEIVRQMPLLYAPSGIQAGAG